MHFSLKRHWWLALRQSALQAKTLVITEIAVLETEIEIIYECHKIVGDGH